MKKLNRVRKDTKRPRGGLQGKWPSSSRIDGCREVKVVTVREEPRASALRSVRYDCPGAFFDLWRKAIAKSRYYQEDKEHLFCLLLDTRYKLKGFCLISIGSLNESIAHPREIFRPAVVDSAHAIVVVHNHPSGDPSPSRLDIALTRQLYLVGELLQIKLLDHIIVGDSEYFSFRQCPKLWPENGRAVTTLSRTLNGQIPSLIRYRPAKRIRKGSFR